MLEATRGARNPMVMVRAEFSQAELRQSTIYADLDVRFAGQARRYSHVAFQRQSQGNEMRIAGTVPSTCSDFDFERPSFLGMLIGNNIPVQVEAAWKQMEPRPHAEPHANHDGRQRTTITRVS